MLQVSSFIGDTGNDHSPIFTMPLYAPFSKCRREFRMSEETPVGPLRSRKSKRTAKKHTSPKREPGTDKEQEQILKFLIGLRLLGEKKRERVLQYMETLKQETEGNKDNGI